jgi:hypothetical protein
MIATPMVTDFWNVVTCQKCNKKFLIENERLKKHAQFWRSVGKAIVVIWVSSLNFVEFSEAFALLT